MTLASTALQMYSSASRGAWWALSSTGDRVRSHFRSYWPWMWRSLRVMSTSLRFQTQGLVFSSISETFVLRSRYLRRVSTIPISKDSESLGRMYLTWNVTISNNELRRSTCGRSIERGRFPLLMETSEHCFERHWGWTSSISISKMLSIREKTWGRWSHPKSSRRQSKLIDYFCIKPSFMSIEADALEASWSFTKLAIVWGIKKSLRIIKFPVNVLSAKVFLTTASLHKQEQTSASRALSRSPHRSFSSRYGPTSSIWLDAQLSTWQSPGASNLEII